MRHLDLGSDVARLRRIPSGWMLTFVAPVGAPAAGVALTAAAASVAAAGGGTLRTWSIAGDEAVAAAATAAGMRPERELHELRRPLPIDEPSDLRVRAFAVGRDEDEWLEVNNRAFAWHPEQGGWQRDDLAERMAEPWFDPAGFLLHHDDEGRLMGFCWTKVHATDPPVGEIYVIATDPAHAPRGLGRRLVVAGLHHLQDAGLRTAMLYVDASNEAGRRLYDSLGFTLHHVDRSFVTEIAAA